LQVVITVIRIFLIQAGREPLLLVHKQPRELRQEQLKILCWQKYNDLENVATLIEANKNEIAAIIVEPVAGIWVVFRPIKGFLRLTPIVYR
jgi:glutamate-1-semialdehyde 2,1-aminomutase